MLFILVDATAMGKKKSKEEDTSNTAAAPASGEETAAVIELHQVDTGDIIKVKQVLDESVIASLIDACKLEENHYWSNIKLILMAAACVFASIAQFAPIPFPESRMLLGVCGTIYFIISGILQLILVFVDNDAIGIMKPQKEGEKGLRIRTLFPRYTEFYTLIIEYEDKKEKENDKSNTEYLPFVKETWSVGKFFDVDGYFDAAGFEAAVAGVYERFKNKQFDKEEDEKKND